MVCPVMLPAYICHALAAERARQDAKFGWLETPTSRMANGTEHERLGVLLEEVLEVVRAVNDGEPIADLHAELYQVGAVAVAWVQADVEKESLRQDAEEACWERLAGES